MGENMIDDLKKSILQSMQRQSHEIKYHKQFIESSLRRCREKTKGDIWTEMIEWYDLIKDLEFATHEIRRELLCYHQLHDVIDYINNHKEKEAK
jgi:hypothetical protein